MKYLTTLLFSLVVLVANSQSYFGSVEYTSVYKKMKADSVTKNEDILSFVKQALKSNQEKTYVLDFNNFESTFKSINELEKPNTTFLSTLFLKNSDELIYKNISKNHYKITKELLGKKFLIIDTLTVHKWILKDETKQIGEFTCRKAIKKETTILSNNEEKEFEIIAWYCPEIPVSSGPEIFWGLPGLILEIEKPTYFLLTTKMSLNLEKDVVIVEPKKGEVVSNKEFEIIAKNKLKELKESFKN